MDARSDALAIVVLVCGFAFFQLLSVWLFLSLRDAKRRMRTWRRGCLVAWSRACWVAEHLDALASRVAESKIKNKETGEVLDLKHFENYIFPEELTSLAGELRDDAAEDPEKSG